MIAVFNNWNKLISTSYDQGDCKENLFYNTIMLSRQQAKLSGN